MVNISVASNTEDEELYKQLGDCIVNFVIDIIHGNECGLFKSEIKITPLVIQLTAANYINVCYKALILKDDQYVVNKFKEMTDLKNHSEICLLNIIMQIVVMVHLNLDRTLIDISSPEALESSTRIEIIRVIDPMREIIRNVIVHECHGEKIENCDPNKPLFALGFD